jgi:DNA-binding Lrp family transcriptional regulator/DNA-binding transcriptional regulator YiaG
MHSQHIAEHPEPVDVLFALHMSRTPSSSANSNTKPPSAETVCSELVRALRGRRSCAQLSRRLGYRSNIVRRWEAGECWPTASTFLEACTQLRPSTATLFPTFFQRTPEWLDLSRPFTPESVAAFLRQLRGKTPIGVLAERTLTNRYTLGRWLSGKAHPSFPDFLRVVEAASRRSLDLVATICDPGELPSLAPLWTRLQNARESAYSEPWSHAVLRALELEGRPARREAAWLSQRLGISEAEIKRNLTVLSESGQIQRSQGQWALDRVIAVDTSRDVHRSKTLKAAWTEVALGRLRQGSPGSFGYSVFAVSHADLERLRELHLEYIRAMQSLIASSSPAECVGLYCAQLLDLGT